MKSVHKKIMTIAGICLFGVFAFNFTQDYFEVSKNLDIFNTLYRELNVAYVDETKPGELMKTAIDAMLESLDPYTNYIPESDIEDYRYMTTGEYGGIGALIRDIDNKITITEPYEGFAAYKAGLRAGDVIVEVNGSDVRTKKTDDITPMLKGQAGTPVKLKVIHAGQSTAVEVNLSREEIKVKSVPYYGMLDGQTGYIKLNQFTGGCADEVKEAVLKLKAKNCKSLVLDLRGNPGGLLDEAVKLVNLFVEKGNEIVFTKGKIKDWDKSYVAENSALDSQIPMVVLVDQNAASASEITAGALQDLDRAVVLGQRSYGKGLVQQTRDLTYNAKLKVTVAKYYIPSGRCIQALDYSHRDEEGHVEKVPDSLTTAFKTKNGRIVYDGAGILPDIKTEPERNSSILISLFTKNYIFFYATNYVLAHPQLDPINFSLSDADYTAFLDYLKDKDYSYKTQSEVELDDFKADAEKEKYFEDVKAEYETLMAKMKTRKNDDLIKNKQEIKQFLEEEIVSRFRYQTGRIEVALHYDQDVKEALKILGDPTRMKSVLSTITPPTRPFNPNKRF